MKMFRNNLGILSFPFSPIFRIILTSFLLMLTTYSQAVPLNPEPSASNQEIKFQDINHEIEFLEKQLKQMRKQALNNEIHAQPYMIDNWHQFAEEIKNSEENEKKIVEIKRKIQELNKKKSLIPQNNPLK